MRMDVIQNDGAALEAWLNDVFKRWRFANIRFESEIPIKYIYVLSELDQIKKLPHRKAIPLRLMLLAFQVPEIESLHRLAGNVINSIMSLLYTDFFNREFATEFFKVVAEWMTEYIEPLRLSENIFTDRNAEDLALYCKHLQIMAAFYTQQQKILLARTNQDRISLLYQMFDTTKEVTVQNFEKYQWRLTSLIMGKSRFNEAEKKALLELQSQYAECTGLIPRMANEDSVKNGNPRPGLL